MDMIFSTAVACLDPCQCEKKRYHFNCKCALHSLHNKPRQRQQLTPPRKVRCSSNSKLKRSASVSCLIHDHPRRPAEDVVQVRRCSSSVADLAKFLQTDQEDKLLLETEQEVYSVAELLQTEEEETAATKS